MIDPYVIPTGSAGSSEPIRQNTFARTVLLKNNEASRRIALTPDPDLKIQAWRGKSSFIYRDG